MRRLTDSQESVLGERGTPGKEASTIDIDVSIDGERVDGLSLYFVEEGNRAGAVKDLMKALRDMTWEFED